MNLLPAVFDNPILIRELRRRMRGRALVYSMIGYIGIMSLVAMVIMLSKTPMGMIDFSDTGSGENFLQKLVACGTTIFRWITTIQLLLVLIIAPTITAGMTTGERERKTFEFLQVTTIRPWAYIMGSFLSTVFYVFLALLCALPPLCVSFLYGGVAPSDVFQWFLLMLAGSVILSAYGLYISSVRDRTRAAQGIVVFTIFLLLFGGRTLFSTFLSYFGGAIGFGAGGSGAGAPTQMFGLPIPMGALVFVVTAFLTGVFLLLAARKLYRSDERAFTYWQFSLLLLAGMAVMIGLARGRPLSDPMALVFSIVSAMLLATAAVCFGVGRMEVGDEMWHLKRMMPFLRRIDEGVFYLAAVAVVWALATRMWGDTPSGSRLPAGFVSALISVALGGFAFFVVLGRAATAVFFTRRIAGRIAMAAIAGFWVVLPFVGWLFALASSTFDDMTIFLDGFSPIFLMLDYIKGQGRGIAHMFSGDWFSRPGSVQTIIYIGLAVVGAFYGEARRWRWGRKFDYHFDMPGA